MAAQQAVTLLRHQLAHGSKACRPRALTDIITRRPSIPPNTLAASLSGSYAAAAATQTLSDSRATTPCTLRRLFSTTTTARARLVDDEHLHHSPAFGARAADSVWSSLAGETARALWRQAKARVEAEERRRRYRPTSFRTWRPAAFRSCPHWRAKQKHRCSHGWPWGKRGGRDGHAFNARGKKDGSRSGAHIAPVSGCRPSGPGWGWYLAVNERRRRDPTRRAEFRHVYRSLHPHAPDPGAGCFSLCRTKFRHPRGPCDLPPRPPGGSFGPRRFKRSRAEHYAARERAVRRVKRILMRFCADSPNSSWRRTGRSGTGGGGGSRDGWRGARSRRSLHNVYQGRHHFVDPRRPFHEGKKGASMIQVGVGTDEYRAASIMSVRAANPATRPRIFLARSRPQVSSFAERIRTARAASSSSRLFSTTPARSNPLVNLLPVPGTLPCAPVTFCPLELALPLLVPLATILKSSAALNCLAAITRISLTLLPLSVRGKILHSLRERYTRDPASISSSIWSSLTRRAGGTATLEAPSSFLTRWNAMVGLPLLLLTPLFLLALVAIASLERTPVTGRWRIVMLSPAEEAELVDSVLSAPTPTIGTAPEGTSRDWVQILRRVLQLPDEGSSPTTGRRILLGGEVLDQRDWRVRWTEAVLVALEKGGVGALDNHSSNSATGGPTLSVLRPPPTEYPLEPRPEALSHQEGWRDELLLAKPFEAHEAHKLATLRGAAALALDYDLLVIQNDAVNAFSFGFGPGPAQSTAAGPAALKRGVIVVYTGFLREILGHDDATGAPPLRGPPTRRSSILGGFRSKPPAPALPDPIAANLVPPTLPTDAQTKALAVLLSHELAHLALSHTLESYASTSLLLPHLARLTTDVVRTVLYPITAIFGPFLNDALGGLLNESARGGLGVVGQAVNSCESRKLESEADLVALRLLAAAGIDPHFALSFWEERVATNESTPSSASDADGPSHLGQPHPLRLHSKHDTLDGLMRSHPVGADRVRRIREELAGWERWWSSHQGMSPPAVAT
ncbi:hypothetical protein JCM3774_000822 [Rhodotorula dairenensis]